MTDRDITLCLADNGDGLDRMKVQDLMSFPAATVSASDEASAAIAEMQRRGVRRLPVVTDDGVLCGVLSIEDLLSNLLDIFSGGAHLARSERREEVQREIERVFRAVF